DGASGAIVVWPRSGPFAQRVSAAGTLQWGIDGIALSGSSSGSSAALVPDGSGGAIVAWANSNTFVQRVSAVGALQWGANGVALTAAGSTASPTITSSGTGGAIVTWQDHRGSNYDIYAQQVDGAGAPQWAANGVALCTAAG